MEKENQSIDYHKKYSLDELKRRVKGAYENGLEKGAKKERKKLLQMTILKMRCPLCKQTSIGYDNRLTPKVYICLECGAKFKELKGNKVKLAK